jgi:hypothetical protein
MTNKEAFMTYFPDDSRAEFVLGVKLIDPTLSDQVPVSGALGMIESATAADYSQGRTSETLSAGARSALLKNAKAILLANGIYWNDGSQPTVGAITW